MKPTRTLKLLGASLAALALTSALPAASTSWVAAPTDANWVTGTNWAIGTAPGTAAGGYNNASRNGDIATFNQAIDVNGYGGASSPVVIDTNRFLLGLTFGTGAGSYVIGSSSGNLLQLDRAGSLLMQAGVTNPQVIANPIRVRQQSSTNATYTFQNDSTTPSATLSLTVPDFILTSANGRPTTLTLTGTNTGDNTISSNITDAMGGQNVGIITKTGSGRWVLSGANTFTLNAGSANPGFQVNGGTLSIQNNLALGSAASGANGNQTSINSGGTLELANGITLLDGIILNLNNGGTLSSVGSTTSHATLRLPTAIAGVSGTVSTAAEGDVLTLGNGANDITGGMADSVINISGPGTVSLPEANNYIGSWSVNSGTLLLGHANSLGTAAAGLGFGADSTGIVWLNGVSPTLGSLSTNASPGSASVENGAATDATLTVTGAGNFGGSLADGSGGGKLALVKAGTGTLSLSGTSTLTGGTSVSGGTLSVTGTLPGAVSVAAGTTLGGTGTLSGSVSLASGATVSPGTGTGSVATLAAGSLTFEAGSAFTAEFASPSSHDKLNVTGSGGLTLNGGGVTLLDAGTQLGFNTSGTYELIQYSGAINGSGTGALAVLNPQAGKTYSFGSTATAVTVTIGDASVNASWIADANGSWANSANWQGGTIPNGSGQAASFTQALTAPRTVTLDGNVSVGGVTLSGATHPYTIAQGSSGALTFDNGASQANLIVLSGNQSVSAPVALASNLIASTVGSLSLSGDISGSGSLTKSGAGSLTLSGANTYAGGTSVTGGTLIYSGLSSLGSGNLSFDGATLVLAPGNVDDLTARTVTIGSGGLTLDTNGNSPVFAGSLGNDGTGGLAKTGAGTLTLAAGNTYAGPTSVTGGDLVISANSSLGSPAAGAALSLDGATLQSVATFSLDNGGTAARPVTIGNSGASFNPTFGTTLTVPGTLSGSSEITVTGGTLELSGDNVLSRTGSYVLSGTLALGGGQANTQKGIGDGLGTVTFNNGGTLAANGSANDIGDTGTLSNPLVVSDGVTGTLLASYRGRVSGSLTGNGTFNVVVAPYVRSNFSGNWSAFTGQINITTSNGAYGEFRISDFQANMFNNARVNLGPSVVLHQVFNPPTGTGTVTTQPIGELSGDASSSLGGNPVDGRFVNWQVGGLGTDSTFAGVIQNGVGQTRLTKVGAGTLTLAGNCTFTGSTTINEGILQIGDGGASGSLGSGDVIVNSQIVFNRSGDLVQANAFSGAGSLVKNGAGSLTLSGVSTLSGAVTVNVGSLLVDGSLDASTVGAGLGTTLGGTGTLSGAVSLPAGATLSPGNAATAVESLAVGSATVAGTVRIEYDADLPAATDSLAVTGALDLTGATLDLANVSPVTEPLGGPAYILATYGSLNGTFATVNGLPEGYALDYAYNDGMSSNNIALVAAPSTPIGAWADAYGLSGPAADPAADPDGDGFNNLAEFAFNSVPNQSAPNNRLVQQVQNVSGQPTLTYTIPVRTAATTAAVAAGLGFEGEGIRYNIQGATVLGTWTHAVTEVVPALDAGLPALETGWSYRTFTLGDNLSNIPKGFLRVRVETIP